MARQRYDEKKVCACGHGKSLHEVIADGTRSGPCHSYLPKLPNEENPRVCECPRFTEKKNDN